MSKPPVEPPYLSVCMIAHNAAVPVLPRLFETLINRPSGPLPDEIVIAWNGTGDEPALNGFDFKGVDLKIIKIQWEDNFAKARQQSFEAASGVWRMYLDSDDLLSMPDDEVVDRSLAKSEMSREDADKSGEGGLKAYLRDLPPEINQLWLPYDYRSDADGNVYQRLWRCRAVRWADGWAWRHPVHEDIAPVGGCLPRAMMNAGLVVIHDPVEEPANRSARNLKILQTLLESEGDQPNPRTLQGIGSGLLDMGRDDEAFEYFHKALAYGAKDEDQYVIRQLLVQIHQRANRVGLAEEECFKLIGLYPDRPHGYLALGETHNRTGNHAKARVWLEKGLEIENPQVFSIDIPAIRHGHFRALYANVLLNLNLVEGALEAAELAAANCDYPHVKSILTLCREANNRVQLLRSHSTLVAEALDTGDVLRAQALLDNTPPAIIAAPGTRTLRIEADAAIKRAFEAAGQRGVDMGTNPTAALRMIEAEAGDDEPIEIVVPDSSQPCSTLVKGDLIRWSPGSLLARLSENGRVESLYSEPDPDRDVGTSQILATYWPEEPTTRRKVAIYAPHFVQTWGPHTPQLTGCGGTEEAVVYLSAALAAAGCDVEVYCPLPHHYGRLHVHQFVRWYPTEEFYADIPVDHVIGLRCPWLMGMPEMSRLPNRRVWVWHHDHAYPEDSWGAGLAQRAGHFYVSDWQRRGLEAVSGATQGAVIYNGIPEAQIQEAWASKGERDPYRFVWASMPTRRLDRMLAMWPEIKERWPKATLDIFYGHHTAAQLWRFNQPEVGKMLDALRQQVVAMADLGVRWLGRVGQAELSREFVTAGVMAYPSDFPETYGIAFTRAAACGVIPVVTEAGALPETSPNGCVLGPVDDEHWEDQWDVFMSGIEAAIKASETERAALASQTLKVRSWDRVARRVIDAFVAHETKQNGTLMPTSPPFDEPPEPRPEPMFLVGV